MTSKLNIPTIFDWQSIAQQNKPGTDTQEQRERLEELETLTKSITSWANYYGLPTKRVRVSAYTGIYNSPLTVQHELAVITAKYTLWLFVLDDYIDRLDYTQFGFNSVADKMRYLDSGLTKLTEPLYKKGNLVDSQLSEYGLEKWPTSIETDTTTPRQNDADKALGAALENIYDDLLTNWNTHQESQFNLANFTTETACVVAAMRGEMKQSFIFQATGQLPEDLTDYLRQSKYSICLRAAGSIAVGFDQNSALVWKQAISTMEPGAKVLRLVNDLANITKEIQEQKINGVSIGLVKLGYQVFGAYQKDSKEIQAASQIVLDRIETEMDIFTEKFIQLPPSYLQFYLCNSMAFTIAMYEAGDYAEL